jgi:integrase
MMIEEYETKDGRRVWLSRDEVEALLDVADDPLRKVALRLGAEVGLRSHEVVEVRPEHVVDGGEAGKMLVVPEGKGDKLREAPIPDSLADTVDAAASFGGVEDDEVLVDRSTRAIRNWVAALEKN